MNEKWRGILIISSLSLALFFSCRQPPVPAPLGATYSQLAKPEVWKVPSNTQAQILGLNPGDVILSYNDIVISTLADLYHAESLAKGATEKVKLVVLRETQELTLEAKPEPLRFIPVAMSYSGSLAKALEDIMNHFGQPGYYDWLSALTGESFTLTVREKDCASWGMGGKAGELPEGIAELTGLAFTPLWNGADTDKTRPIEIISAGLKKGQAILVYGRWAKRPQHLWGIATHYNPLDSLIYGYSLDSGEEQPLTEEILSVYAVKCQKKVQPDPEDFLLAVLDQALAQGLATSDTGWHSGLAAYDILIKELSQLPSSLEETAFATECFYRLLGTIIAGKESAIQFFIDMKETFPENAGLFDEVIGRHRAIIGKLEAITANRLPLTNRENQEKLTRVLIEIQQIENDLLGIYEEIIGEM